MRIRLAGDLLKRLAKDASGTAIVEFVVVAPLFFALFFGVMQIALQFFYAAGAEKAVQRGVRTAVVVSPSVAVPAINGLSATGGWGEPCSPTSDPCAGFATASCTGAACGGGFAIVLQEMQAMFPAVQAANVTVTYEYVAIGFAGGPTAPAVTVSITGMNWPVGPFAAIQILLGATPGSATLPTIRATLTGEDLAT